jgi:hypothetical protein
MTTTQDIETLTAEIAERTAAYDAQISKGYPPCEINISLLIKAETRLAALEVK